MPIKKLLGYVGVDSGQIIITDPCYLTYWEDNETDFEHRTRRDYSYAGASNASCEPKKGGGQLYLAVGTHKKFEAAVAAASGWGDGQYPVYAEYGTDERIKRLIIEF